MAAREAVRAAVTAPDLDAWQVAGEAAGSAVAGRAGAGDEVVVVLAPAGAADVGPGRFVTATVTRRVALLGWPLDAAAPEVEVVAHAIARVDPHRARCVGRGCASGR